MQGIKQWYLQLSERERILVICASAVSIVVLFYYLLWSPLHNAVTQQRAALNNEQQLLVWVQEQSNRAQLMRSRGQVTTYSGSLTQLVNQTTRSANISVSRLQPQDDELQVWIDEVPFNALMRWLADLEQRGIVILQSDFSETNDAGIVQVRRLQLGKQ
jgi:general secretion pathway protein M